MRPHVTPTATVLTLSPPFPSPFHRPAYSFALPHVPRNATRRERRRGREEKTKEKKRKEKSKRAFPLQPTGPPSSDVYVRATIPKQQLSLNVIAPYTKESRNQAGQQERVGPYNHSVDRFPAG